MDSSSFSPFGHLVRFSGEVMSLLQKKLIVSAIGVTRRGRTGCGGLFWIRRRYCLSFILTPINVVHLAIMTLRDQRKVVMQLLPTKASAGGRSEIFVRSPHQTVLATTLASERLTICFHKRIEFTSSLAIKAI